MLGNQSNHQNHFNHSLFFDQRQKHINKDVPYAEKLKKAKRAGNIRLMACKIVIFLYCLINHGISPWVMIEVVACLTKSGPFCGTRACLQCTFRKK
jgi:peroxiredoxin family protein